MLVRKKSNGKVKRPSGYRFMTRAEQDIICHLQKGRSHSVAKMLGPRFVHGEPSFPAQSGNVSSCAAGPVGRPVALSETGGLCGANRGEHGKSCRQQIPGDGQYGAQSFEAHVFSESHHQCAP